MGTNYYLTENECPHCGRSGGEFLHIGKLSAGWLFALRVYPEDYPPYEGDYVRITGVFEKILGKPTLDTLDDWILMFQHYRIVDEYGRDVSAENLLSSIRQDTWNGRPAKHHAIDGHACFQHGPTYDYFRGHFS